MTTEPLLDREKEMISEIEEIKKNLRNPKNTSGTISRLKKNLRDTTSRLLHSFYEGSLASSTAQGRGPSSASA